MQPCVSDRRCCTIILSNSGTNALTWSIHCTASLTSLSVPLSSDKSSLAQSLPALFTSPSHTPPTAITAARYREHPHPSLLPGPMAVFLPTQEPGPGPTDAPLPTYQSYSAYTTTAYDYTTTVTRVAYDPQGTAAPSLVIDTQTGRTTSVGYSVVNLPLLYSGPFPAPPLGTLFTTAGQIIATSPPPAPTPTQTQGSPSQPTPTAGSGSQGSGGGGATPSQGGQPAPPASTGSPGNSGGAGNGGAGEASGGGQSQGAGTTGNGQSDGGAAQGGGNNGNGQSGGGASQGGGNTGNGQSDGGSNAGGGNGSGQGSGSGGSQGTGGTNGQGSGSGSGSGNGQAPTATAAPTQSGGGMPVPAPLPTTASSTGSGGASDALSSASAASVSASEASVSASSAAASASAASVGASNAAQSSSASAASASAASAASSASLQSASASSISASASSASTSASPTPTSGGLPPLGNGNDSGLSGGQIAGIVVGSVLGLLLLLLACLLCARRRKRKRAAGGAAAGGPGLGRKLSDKWASGFSHGAGRGTYAALGVGAGAGAAGLGLAAAGHRGSVNSNEWEEDRLSGGDGSGFFVVGGKRLGGEEHSGRAASTTSFSRTERNGTPSGPSTAATGGLAGIGAGIAAALGAGKRRRSSGKGKGRAHQAVPTSRREADFADDDDADHMLGSDDDDNIHSEQRGLMGFGQAGDASEMRQAGPSGWMAGQGPGWGTAAAGAGVGALGAGAMYAAHRRKDSEQETDTDQGQEHGTPSAHRQSGLTASTSAGEGYSSAAETSTAGHYLSSHSGSAAASRATGSGSGSGSGSGTGTGSGPNASSNSTGTRTEAQSSPQVTHASRQERPLQTYGNVAPDGPAGKSRLPSFTGGFGDGDLGMVEGAREGNPFNEEALLGAGAAGLGLGALAARHRDSGASGQGDSDNGHDDRYKRFLSTDTPLLGPGAAQRRSAQEGGAPPPAYTDARNASTFGTAYSHGRLPTIRSVGEFGERDGASPSQRGTLASASNSGSGSGTRSGYGSVRSAPLYASSAGPSNPALPFSTPVASPGMGQDPFHDRESLQDIPDEQSSSQQHHSGVGEVAGAAAGAGFLGGLFPGWTRWTKGDDGKERQDDGEAPDETPVQTTNTGHERGQESEADMAAEVQSQRASVYNTGSNLGHGLASGQVSHSPSLRQDSRSLREQRGNGSGSGSGSGSGNASIPSRPSQNDALEEAEEEGEGQAGESRDTYGPDPAQDQDNDADDEDAAVGGYAASVSNLSQNVSSGNSRSASRRSGQTTSTGVSRGPTSSGTGSSNRRNESSSGGSTGAASYSPSYLGRQGTSSTRGGATSSSLSSRGAARGSGQSSSSRRLHEETEQDVSSSTGGAESDGHSSIATAGGGEDLRRFSMDPGLGSLQETPEESVQASTYYPSQSLGAAVRRRAEREAQEGDTPRSIPTSLLPGSSSTPSSSQWRQSPRVETVSQRAAAANLTDEPGAMSSDRWDELRQSIASPPQQGTSSPRRTRLPDPEAARRQGSAADDADEDRDSSRDRGIWPKFLRF